LGHTHPGVLESGGQHLARQDRGAAGDHRYPPGQGIKGGFPTPWGPGPCRQTRTDTDTRTDSGRRWSPNHRSRTRRRAPSLRGPGPFNGEYQNTPSLLLVPAGTGQDWLPLETTSPARPGDGRPEPTTTFQDGTDSPRIVVSPWVRTRPPPVTASASGPHHSGGGAPHRCYRRPRVWDVLALLPQAAKPSREKASSGPEPALTSRTPDLESVSSPSLLRTACGLCG